MLQKITKLFFIALIISGIVLTIFNFLPISLKAAQGSFGGTITEIPGAGPNPDNPAWIEGDLYCVGEPSNCYVVIEP